MGYVVIMQHYFIKQKLFMLIVFLSLMVIGVQAQQNVPLERKDTIGLKEVTIERNQQTKITGTLSGKITLHADGVKSLPAILGNTDLMKMLELTPGVQNSGDGNSNMYVRGGDAGQNLLLYNGTMIYSPGHILNFFPLFNIDHLSSVELSKGGTHAQYPGFLSSAIIVKSKENIPEEFSVRGSVGLLSSQATVAMPLSSKWGAYASVRKTYLDMLIKPVIDATVNRKAKHDMDDMGYDFYDANFTLVGELSDRNRIVVNGFMGEDELNIKDEQIALDGFLKWKNTSLSAKMETSFSDKVSLEQTIIYSRFDNKLRTEQSDMYINLLSKVEDIGYRGNLNLPIWNIPFVVGLQYTYHNIMPQETKVYNAGFEYGQKTLGRNKSHDISVFAASSFEVMDNLLLEPGVRYNLFSTTVVSTRESKVFQNVDVRLTGRYKLNSSAYLRGGLSQNHQYLAKLTPSSLGLPTDFWVSASGYIPPQQGIESSLGYYKLLGGGSFELSSDIFYRRMKDVTEFNQNFLDNENVSFTDKILFGKGLAYGIEFLFKKNTGKLTGWVSYSLGRSTRKFDDINRGKSFSAKYDRTHDLSFVGVYTFNNRWDASLVYLYATGNTYTQPTSWYFLNNTPVKSYDEYNNVRMPDYNRMDISLNYWFKKDNGLNFSVFNTFMTKNPVYVFMMVGVSDKSGDIELATKRKYLFRIVPSVSWRFKF